MRTDTGYSVNGLIEKANAFFVKSDNLTYSYNNGYLSGHTPEVAARQFVRGLEKIPSLIQHQQEKIDNLTNQQKLLTDIAAKPWGKGDKLQELKSELRQVESRLQTIGQEKEPEKTQQKEKTTAKKHQDQSLEIT